MFAPNDPPTPEAGSLERGRFLYFPVVPGRLEFAAEVRRAILKHRPQVGRTARHARTCLETRYRAPPANVPHFLPR